MIEMNMKKKGREKVSVLTRGKIEKKRERERKLDRKQG